MNKAYSVSVVMLSLAVAACGALPSPTPAALLSAAPVMSTSAPSIATPAPATTALAAATPAAPTASRPPPTATRLSPTATAIPPTATRLPPTATPPPPTPTFVPDATAVAELTALLKRKLPPAPPTPGAGFGVMDVHVTRLKTNIGDSWLAFSTGFRYFQPLADHIVTVYTRAAAGWQETARIALDCPDYLGKDSVKQVQIEPERIWLAVDGGAGAHGGCFNLLSFDGKALKMEVEHGSPSPGGGRIVDLNGDKMSDVVLDLTEPYVFCYACGVRYHEYRALTWSGGKLSEVKLSPLPASAAADVRTLNERAVALAQGGLWKDALNVINQAQALKPSDATFTWNAALIKLHAEAQAQNIKGGYPLLGYIFYGDYDGALSMVRAYRPDVLFNVKTSPLITGTMAQGWEKDLTLWITRTTTLAIKAQPDLAGAYFLRGWALNLAKPGSPEAVADIAKAAQLQPNDMLFSEAAAYIKQQR